MNLTAKITRVMETVSGESKNGKWSKQDVIVETLATFPRFVCLTIWGDKIDKSQIKEGSILNFHIDIESKENNARWYTTIKVWKIEVPGSEFKGASPIAPSTNSIGPLNEPLPPWNSEEEEILPF